MSYTVQPACRWLTAGLPPPSIVMGMGDWPIVLAVEQREGVEVEISGEALVGGVQRGLSITFTGTRQETAELSGRLVEELARVGVTPAIDAPEAAP